MKTILAAGGLTALAALGAVASGLSSPAPSAPAPSAAAPSAPARTPAPADWTGPLRSLGMEAPGTAQAEAPAPADLDVVDAHWMALTMWGEARGEGEEAMRAVGHVIDNRRRHGRHGSFATETVTAAWQFSCWNENDPNRAAMLGVLDLPPGSQEGRMWQAARQLADEILAGRSADPTGGALFYHSIAVAPSWSRGVTPVVRIGNHIFFHTARRA